MQGISHLSGYAKNSQIISWVSEKFCDHADAVLIGWVMASLSYHFAQGNIGIPCDSGTVLHDLLQRRRMNHGT